MGLFRFIYNLKLKTQKNVILTAAAICLLVLFCEASEWCPANGKISCPCGQKGNFVSVPCDPKLRVRNEPCEKFSFCETCSDNLQTCSSCPPGYFGLYCTEEGGNENTSNSITPNFRHIEKFRSKRSVNCPDLQSPKLGSIRCVYGRTEKSCTGRCLPGHSFDKREVEEITLRCFRGRWVPESSFPPCISEGKCDLEMTGAGTYNCTTNIRGTVCDIRCTSHNRWVSNRYSCYPGQSWNPRLPYCIRKKEVAQERFDCKCQNGGTCDYETERCRCPDNFKGLYCEHYVYVSKSSCTDPGPITNGEVVNSKGRVPGSNQLYGEDESLIYSCLRGYALVGLSILTCLPSGTWSSVAPKCLNVRGTTTTISTTTTTAKPKEKIFCKDPGFISNGNRWTTEGRTSSVGEAFEVGRSVVFSCKEGYALEGLSILTCQTSRRWSTILPECKKIENDEIAYCKDPGTDPNGQRIEDPWIDAKKKKDDIPTDEFPEGFKLNYSCKEGYDLLGDSTLLCLFTGTWSAPAPTCEAGSVSEKDEIVYCEDPGTDPNGQRTEDPWIDAKRQAVVRKPNKFPQGFKLKYSCKEGYDLLGDSSTLLCLFNGIWSAPAPTCVQELSALVNDEIAYCEDPGTDPNGQRTEVPWIDAKRQTADRAPNEFPQGFKLEYSCKEGYGLLGDSTLLCDFTGTWSAPAPACIPGPLSGTVAYCKDPGDIEHGRKVVVLPINQKKKEIYTNEDEVEYPEGVKLEYFCLSGFQLVGRKVLTCMSTKNWDSRLPECRKKRGF